MRKSLRSTEEDVSNACDIVCLSYAAEVIDIAAEIGIPERIDLLADLVANSVKKGYRARVFVECTRRLKLDPENIVKEVQSLTQEFKELDQ